MTPSHLSDDRLTALAHDVLVPAERRDALDHLRGCATCEARFRREVADRERLAIRRDGVGRDLPVGADGAETDRSAPRRLPALAPALAAMIAFLLVLPGVLPSPTPGGGIDPSAYWLPVDIEAAALRSPAAAPYGTPAVRDGLDAYARRDPAATVRALDASGRTHAHTSPLALYLADGLLRTGEVDAARALLDRADPATMPPPWRGRGRWVEARAHEAAGDRTAARAVLEALVRDDPELADLARRWLSVREQEPGPDRR